MTGEKIIIRETGQEDLANVMQLWNNGEVMQFVGYPNGLGITLPQLELWLTRMGQLRRHYSIYLADGTYCGETFYRVDPEIGATALDIKLLPAARGKGVATRALSFAINQAFRNWQARWVYVDPHPSNSKAWALYERLGFISKPRPDFLEAGLTYLEITRDRWQGSELQQRAAADFHVQVSCKDVILRDYIASDIEDDIRWMTTEIAWHEWDAPWEAEEDLKNFVPADFREKQLEKLKQYRSKEILRSSFEICTRTGVHLGGCNSYRIDDDYQWIPRTAGSGGYRTLGLDICESAYWGKGYGTMALVAFINYFLAHETKPLYLQTWSGNLRMVHVAEKLGFEICQRVPSERTVRGQQFDGLTFRLDLAKYETFRQRYMDRGDY